MLPKNIQLMIADQSFETDKVGMSNSEVFCFDNMVLKIEKQREEANNEHFMMKWLDGKLSVPKVLCFEEIEDTNYLLMSKIKGQMLCSDMFLEHPTELVSLLAKGLRMFWRVPNGSSFA